MRYKVVNTFDNPAPDHFLVEARLKLVPGGYEKCVEGE